MLGVDSPLFWLLWLHYWLLLHVVLVKIILVVLTIGIVLNVFWDVAHKTRKIEAVDVLTCYYASLMLEFWLHFDFLWLLLHFYRLWDNLDLKDSWDL